MPVRIKEIEPGSIAQELGWNVGDEIITLNGRPVADVIDLRFHATDEHLEVKLRRNMQLHDFEIEKEADEPLGVEVEEFRIRTCGDNCVFCFVDQNPTGLREAIYVRDSDFRMSFLYGNYITVTNLRERDMERIVEQRLTPMYISVHCTNPEIRRRMMGHRSQDDRLMEKLHFLRENGIEMHTQVVLVPGYNDGDALAQTVMDLYAMNDAVLSISVVPVGLTAHREGLTELRGLQPAEARKLIWQAHRWQAHFRKEIGRGFVYLSDEIYLLAGEEFPDEEAYDGFPLIENGVGMSRDFLNELGYQREQFPSGLSERRKLTLATGRLAGPILDQRVAPVLRAVANLDVDVVVATNTLFGPPVTVSGLLTYECFRQALQGRDLGDLVLLPPDCVNFEGYFQDQRTPDDLAQVLGVPVKVFGGDWIDVLEDLAEAPVTT